MNDHTIRPIAICVFQHNGLILVFEGYDPIKEETFYRPLGGGIEFGEYSQQAIIREIQEELSATITNIRYLATLENIFVHDGISGHEIVQVYDGTLVNKALYEQETIIGVEDNGETFTAMWKHLDEFTGPNSPPLYPDGLLSLLQRLE